MILYRLRVKLCGIYIVSFSNEQNHAEICFYIFL